MASFQTHPDEELLLRYFDGELPARKQRQVGRHLNACWQCRTHLDELQSTVGDCVRYRKNVLEAHLPGPPAPWSDLSHEFARIDAELAREAWFARLVRWLGAPAVQRWAISGVAAAAIAVAVFYQFRDTPSVQAAALLKRAVLIAENQPQPKRPIRVRTRTGEFLLADRKQAPVVQSWFRAAGYNADLPLSARSYQEWRVALSSKSEHVTALADSYRIHTATPEGDLAVASLTLRSTDLHPLAGRFEFRNQEWVELTEVMEPAIRDGGLSVETNSRTPMRQAVPSPPETAPPGNSATVSQELRVLAALHEIGADLGDPLEVTHEGGRVRVSGVAIPPARQQEIHRVLDPLPNVAVEFAAPPPAPETPPESTAGPQVLVPGAMQMRFEQQLGGRAEFVRFSAQILDWNEAVMARAHALRALAQRYPADAVPALSAPDREILIEMARDHLAALAGNVSNIQHTLAPVLVSLGGVTAQGRPASSSSTWQDGAASLLDSARRVERLLAFALGATQDGGAVDRIPSDLMTALADLQSKLDHSEGLLGR